jgi:hypothetical protein
MRELLGIFRDQLRRIGGNWLFPATFRVPRDPERTKKQTDQAALPPISPTNVPTEPVSKLLAVVKRV